MAKLYAVGYKTTAWRSGYALDDLWIYDDLDEAVEYATSGDVETYEGVVFELVPVKENK